MLFTDVSALPSTLNGGTQNPTSFHLHYSLASAELSGRCPQLTPLPLLHFLCDTFTNMPGLTLQCFLLPFPGHGPVFVTVLTPVGEGLNE